MGESSSPKTHLVAVGFLDELGSKDRYKQILEQDESSGGIDGRNLLLLRELEWIRKARRELSTNLRVHQKRSVIEEVLTAANPSASSVFRLPHVHLSVFSDSLLLHFKLDGSVEGVVRQLTTVLGSVGTFFLNSLSQGHVYRGALEVSAGASLGSRGVVGPAMSEAYKLESEVAQYPRIVIGPNLADLIESASEVPSSAIFVATEARLLSSMVVRDSAGTDMLDFLHMPAQFLKQQAEEVHSPVRDIVRHAYENVVEREAKFIEAGDKKLSDRYALLRRQFDDKFPNKYLVL